jgi:hypothetical protein
MFVTFHRDTGKKAPLRATSSPRLPMLPPSARFPRACPLRPMTAQSVRFHINIPEEQIGTPASYGSDTLA